jgi:hypothetical protein
MKINRNERKRQGRRRGRREVKRQKSCESDEHLKITELSLGGHYDRHVKHF